MIILGLHLGHDGAACIVKDGRLVSALASERLTRQRKSHGVTPELVDYVCATAKVNPKKIDAIALSDYHSAYTWGTIEVREKGSSEIVPDTWNRVFDDEVLEFDVTFRGRIVPGYNVGHHKSHCAAAFFTSPFDKAYCMSMDSSGGEPKTNFVICRGDGNKLEALDTPICAVGYTYGFFTEWLGIGSQMFKAGSTMALASYGRVFDEVERLMPRYVEGAFFSPGGPDYRGWKEDLWRQITGSDRRFTQEESDGEHQRNIAASIQKIFENAILHACQHYIPDDCPNLCLGGGSFLNCTANSRVLGESKFESVHLFPACSDDGCAVGAALYVAHAMFDAPRQKYAAGDLCYLGRPYDVKPIDYERVAKKIADGGIVAWVNGRSEFGPRALGARSMLADPRNPKIAERINAPDLKNREWYRPVCPSVATSHVRDWFDHPEPSPYMLMTCRSYNADAIPGAIHHDGTARHQSVSIRDNADFAALLHAFDDITGVPVLVNTSLNEPGRPIIESREEAREYFEKYPVDMLVLHGKIYEK